MYQDLFGIWHDDDDYPGLNDVPEESAPTEAALLMEKLELLREREAELRDALERYEDSVSGGHHSESVWDKWWNERCSIEDEFESVRAKNNQLEDRIEQLD